MYSDTAALVSKRKASLIFSLSGARGAVTLASVLSIPVLLSNGTYFTQRELIILLSTGVILCSLFITNFILPYVVGKSEHTDKKTEENEACIKILENVVETLEKSVTKQNRFPVMAITSQYRDRIKTLQNRYNFADIDKQKEKELKMQALLWEKQNTVQMVDKDKAYISVSIRYVEALDKQIALLSGKKYDLLPRFLRKIIKNRKIKLKRSRNLNENLRIIELRKSNDMFVIQCLKERQTADNSDELKNTLHKYESSLLFTEMLIENRIFLSKKLPGNDDIEKKIIEIVAQAFQIERDNIQSMFEDGRISREKAKELRNNILLLETELV
ncbi:MAG: hypothetical protein LBF89_06480 [Bacteroidales bacterium]|nr:hypothetical protein [Bacteroidales bacterium]